MPFCTFSFSMNLFVKKFFIGVLFFTGLVLGHSYYIDSFDFWGIATGIKPLNNLQKMKYEFIQVSEFDCVIVGSSRGQSFSPYQLSELTKSNCINLSVGGANTALKMLYLTEALKKNSLKRVVYISDFFEFYSAPVPEEILYNDQLLAGVQSFDESIKTPGLIESFLFLMDQSRFNADNKAFENRLEVSGLKSRGEHWGGDLSLYEVDQKFKLRKEQELKNEIYQNFLRYSEKVWVGDFNEGRFESLVDFLMSLKSKNIELDILLTPYHPDFEERFKQQGEVLNHSHKNWISNWEKAFPGRVWNLQELSKTQIDPSPSFWSDGVHLNKFGAAKLLKTIF